MHKGIGEPLQLKTCCIFPHGEIAKKAQIPRMHEHKELYGFMAGIAMKT